MLTSSFIQVPGIGLKTEMYIWKKGVFSWDDFIHHQDTLNLSWSKIRKVRDYLEACYEHLEKKDAQFFAEILPKSELWRLYSEFKHSVAFVDIETTGLSKYYNEVTLVGLFDGQSFRAYITGNNLSDFQKDIRNYGLIITFNGSLFDLPFIRKTFPGINLPVHIDLRFLLRRLGYSGGLKAIEKKLGIERSPEIKDLDGFDSTVLWNKYVHGKVDALRLLVEYNKADVMNLQALMETGYELMKRRRMPLHGAPSKFAKLSMDVGPSMRTMIRKIGDSQVELRADKKKYFMEIPRRRNRTIQPLVRRLGGIRKAPSVVGIDLSGSEKKASGWAMLQGNHAQTRLIKTDRELVVETVKAKPRIVSIDSPLSIPGGNGVGNWNKPETLAAFGIMRECEKTLRRRGIYVFPCLLPSMKSLTRRGIRLAEELRKLGFEVIESYPGAAQDILGIIRKKIDVGELRQGLLDFGIKGDFKNGKINHDKLDAVTSALVGYFYLADSFEALGNEKEGYLIVPQAHY